MVKIISRKQHTYCSYLARGEHKLSIVVLLVEDGDCYTARLGFGTDEWIAKNGNKLPFDEAKTHFPAIEQKRYEQ